MARSVKIVPTDSDPDSALMSEVAVMRFLGTDATGLRRLIQQKKLARNPITGSFARCQVQAVHDELLREILSSNESALGSKKREVGSLDRFREKPRLV